MPFGELFLFVMSAAFSALLTPPVRALARRVGALDRPGARKIHTSSVPRLGGVAVVLAGLLSLSAAAGLERVLGPVAGLRLAAWLPVLVGGGIVFAVGVWDDLRPVSPLVKFLFQAAAALAAMGLGVQVERITLGGRLVELSFLGPPFTFLWIVGVTNAFNLVDGLDGLAAGLVIIASGTSAAIFVLRGDAQGALVLLTVLGAAAGFLPYNFPPATIFLGDSGSLVVGYVLATTAITRWQKGATALAVAVPLLVFALPITDTLFSMVRRFLGGQRGLDPARASLKERLAGMGRIFEGDQQHIHHQLLGLGLSPRRAVLLLYGLATGFSLLALLTVVL